MKTGYVFVFYDIKEERVNKVNKILTKYLFHEQNSVFRGPITPSLLQKVKSELDKIIVLEYDKILFIELKSEKDFIEYRIGDKMDDNNIL